MKNIILLLLAIFCFACNSDSDDDSSNSTSSTTEISTTPDISATATTGEAPGQVFTPAGIDGIVHHYICPDKCAGGIGDAGGACPICGKTMEHNRAFHGQPAGGDAGAAANENGGINIKNADGSTFGGTPQAQIPQEPAQNAKGVWHYICASGCSGGGGSAAACGKCGETLAHNAEYHK